MPSDILGAECWTRAIRQASFRFISGPVFAQLLMATNQPRARTQSRCCSDAEQHITVPRAPRSAEAVPRACHPNPLNRRHYPLPEAQLDRFLMEIDVDTGPERTPHSVETTGAEETLAKVPWTQTPARAQRLCGACRSAIPSSSDPLAGAFARPGRKPASRQADCVGPGPRAANR